MSTLVVIGYNDLHQAEEVRLKLWKLQKVLEEIQGTGGHVLRTSLSHEDEAKLQAALNAAKQAS